VQVAVTVFVVTAYTWVKERGVLVMTLVDVVVIAGGVIVLVLRAVPLATVTVDRGPVVIILVEVEVVVCVSTGV
jgi:hypothetical protein